MKDELLINEAADTHIARNPQYGMFEVRLSIQQLIEAGILCPSIGPDGVIYTEVVEEEEEEES